MFDLLRPNISTNIDILDIIELPVNPLIVNSNEPKFYSSIDLLNDSISDKIRNDFVDKIIIAKDINDIGSKSYAILPLHLINKYCKKNTHSYEWFSSTSDTSPNLPYRRDRYYKLGFDLDYYSDIQNEDDLNIETSKFIVDFKEWIESNFVISTIKNVNLDVIEFTEKRITSQSFFCNIKQKFKVSKHIIFPYISTLDNLLKIHKLFIEYNLNNVLDPLKMCDKSSLKNGKAMRLLNNTKLGKTNIKKSINGNKKASNFLFGIYDVEEIINYQMLDYINPHTLKSFKEKHNLISINIIKDVKKNNTYNIKKTPGTYDIIENIDNINKLDRISCFLCTIYNDIEIIDISFWSNIIMCITGYAINVTEAVWNEDIGKFCKISYENRFEYLINICTIWTKKGYDNYDKNGYNNMSIIDLRKQCKTNKLTKYSNLLKPELIILLNKLNNKLIIEPINHNKKIRQLFNYLKDKFDNKNTENDYTSFCKNGLYRITKYAAIFNKNVIKDWDINNTLKTFSDLDNSNPVFINAKITDNYIYDNYKLYKNIFIKKPCGKGKTYDIIIFINQYLKDDPYGTIIYITPRKNLAVSLYERLDKELYNIYVDPIFENYLDSKNNVKKFMNNSNCCIISCESINLLNLTFFSKSIIILDEIELLCDNLLSKTCSENGKMCKIMNHLISLTENSINNIYMDAHPSILSKNFISDIATLGNHSDNNIGQNINDVLSFIDSEPKYNFKHIIKINIKTPFGGLKQMKRYFEHFLYESLILGNNEGVFMNNAAYAITLSEGMKTLIPTLKTLVLSSNTKCENMRYIKDPSLISKDKINLLIWTGVICVGFSEESEGYFKHRNVFIQPYCNIDNIKYEVFTANMAIQVQMRIRTTYEYPDEQNYFNNGKGFQVINYFILQELNNDHQFKLSINSVTNDNEDLFKFDTNIILKNVTDKKKIELDVSDFENINNITKYNIFAKENTHYTRTNVICGQSSLCYYENNNNNNKKPVYSIPYDLIKTYSAFEILMNPTVSLIYKNLKINGKLKINSNYYMFTELLNEQILEYKGIYDDTNAIKSIKTLERINDNNNSDILLTITQTVNIFNNHYDVDSIYTEYIVCDLVTLRTDLFKNQYKNDIDFYNIITQSKNKFSESNLSITQIKSIVFFTSYYTYTDNTVYSFDNYNYPFFRNQLRTDNIIKNLILWKYEKNHITKCSSNEYSHIKYILDTIFSNNIINFDDFELNPETVIIDGRIIKENESIINKLYDYYTNLYSLKKNDMKNDNRTLSKLEKIVKGLLGLSIRCKSNIQKKYTLNGKRYSYSEYEFYFNFDKSFLINKEEYKLYQDLLFELFKNFSYDKRINNNKS
jgi:hypothetical protein